jgi:hypothetical protein
MSDPSPIILGIMVLIISIVLLADLRSQVPEPCMTADDQARIRELTFDAIDEAFQKHVHLLFEVWLKDFSPEPKRVTAGMRIGISAYRRARANARQWSAPVCSD